MAVALSYLGWSGFRLDRADGSTLLIDPPADALLPGDRPLTILVTHGHPEHVGGTRARLANGKAGGAVTVCASPGVCRYLARRSACRDVAFRALRPGEDVSVADGLHLGIFGWHHLPLLPPGLGASLRHVVAVASRPVLAAQIAGAALKGPRAGAMLGFRIIVDGQRLMTYAEGLHRRCLPSEVSAASRGCEGGILLAGVEPEDVGHVPGLIAAANPASVVLYEPHAKWRDGFGLPRADLAAVAAALKEQGIPAEVGMAQRDQLAGRQIAPGAPVRRRHL